MSVGEGADAAHLPVSRAGGVDLSALLGSLGVASVPVSDAVSSCVSDFCAGLGVAAEVVSTRFGVLTLSCSPSDAVALVPALSSLRSEVFAVSNGSIDEVRVWPSPLLARREVGS